MKIFLPHSKAVFVEKCLCTGNKKLKVYMPQWVQWLMQFTVEMHYKQFAPSHHLSAVDREVIPGL
jgi:hypothetical protein